MNTVKGIAYVPLAALLWAAIASAVLVAWWFVEWLAGKMGFGALSWSPMNGWVMVPLLVVALVLAWRILWPPEDYPVDDVTPTPDRSETATATGTERPHVPAPADRGAATIESDRQR